MSNFISDIKTAVLIFPLVAALITIPFAIYQYRRYGAIPWLRIIISYSFILYCLCAYFLIILPLPADRHAVPTTPITPRLDLVEVAREVKQILVASSFSLAHPSTWIPVLKNSYIYEIIFNVLLTVPLGAYLCYYFRRTWWQTLLIGMATTMFFELSQYTGLWGIYDYAYRTFDVCDLVTNTFGCMLGFWLMWPLKFLLPDLDRVNQRSQEKGMRPSATRRLTAFLIDLTAVGVTSGIVCVGARLTSKYSAVELVSKDTLKEIYSSAKISLAGIDDGWGVLAFVQSLSSSTLALVMVVILSYLVWMVILPCITGGATLGHLLLGLRITRSDGSRAPRYLCLMRYLLLMFVLAAPLVLTLMCLPLASAGSDASELSTFANYLVVHLKDIFIIWAAITALWAVTLVARGIYSLATNQPLVLLNELITDTRVSVKHADFAQNDSYYQTRGEGPQY